MSGGGFTGRRLLAAAWLALCGCVIGTLAGEVALRFERRRLLPQAARFGSANAFLQGPGMGVVKGLWAEERVAYQPGALISFTLNDQLHEVRINSRGFRTREFAVPKPAGLVRVACIGASTTFQGFANEETYPALLEARLRELRPDLALEALNLGVSGTHADFWLGRLDALFALEPDVVVQYNAVNDFVQLHLPNWARAHPKKAALHGRLLLWDRFVPLAAADFDAPSRQTLAHQLRLRDACRERGIAYVTATFAAPDPASAEPAFLLFLDSLTRDWTGGVVQHYRQYERLLARHNARLEEVARQVGIPLAPAAATLRPARLYFDICHLKPHGLKKLAQAFAAPVASLLPPPVASAR
ncbi:MAG: SGNH/GDSL hydrolase family protein [Thermoanaerobaculia bacterium]